jgi:phytol kinase
VVAGVLLIFLAAEVWRRRSSPPAEWTRKAVHVSVGLVAACFPWLFHSPWTVLGLGVAFAALLWGTRRLGLLQSVHGVERRSRGDFYYVLAVFLLFVAARQRPVFYFISLLVLVVSDTLAALLGSAYGRWTYAVEADRRTLEGSAVFFLATLLAVHVPLLLLTRIDRAASVLISLQLALLVTCFEAISLGGNDNLIVPLATGYLLVKMTPYPASWIAAQLGLQLGTLALMGLVAWRSRVLTFSGAIAAHLFFYGALALAGPRWLVAPALALAGFLALDRATRRAGGIPNAVYQVAAVFYVSIVPVLLFAADNAFATLLPGPLWLPRSHPFYVPYVGALAGQLAIVASLQVAPAGRLAAARRARGAAREPAGPGRRGVPDLRLVLLTGAVTFLLIVPISLWVGTGGISAARLGIAACTCFAALLFYNAARRRFRAPKAATADLRLQAASVAAATAMALPVYLFWIHRP